MSTHPSFTIDQVKWHTRTPGNTETVEAIHRRFRIVLSFLQENGLTTRCILPDGGSINDETAIESHDLTERGFELMRKCYQNWLGLVDHGMSPENLSLFKKYLVKMKDWEARASSGP